MARKARKHSRLLKLDKDIAERVWGHKNGRPTISRRAGRKIGRSLRIGEQRGTDLFHAFLVVGLGMALVKRL